MSKAKIISVAGYLPEKVLTNKDLEKVVETTNEWIVERTGIRQRHVASENENTATIATNAAKSALKESGLKPQDIGMIIVATATPNTTFPAVACYVQAELGCVNAFAFDIQAVCSGFVYAISVAEKYIRLGEVENVMVIGADCLSKIVDWKDRTTCVLFGDGAGAVVLSKNTDKGSKSGIVDCILHSDGKYASLLQTNGGPSSTKTSGHITMNGPEVFKHAVTKMASSIDEIVTKNKLSLTDVKLVVAHQANERILNAVANRLKMPDEKFVKTIASHGNTSAASIPLALWEHLKEHKLNKEDIVIFEALGAGFTWGSVLLRW